ncbi:MAG: hypothetical protein ACRDYD_08795 [Acidimicrobiales bacterium]
MAPTESGDLAKKLIADAVARHRVPPGQLTIHADRGSSMTSNPVTELLTFLGIGRSHSRPHVSNDNPNSDPDIAVVHAGVRFDGRRAASDVHGWNDSGEE